MNFDISIIDTLDALERFVPEWLEFLETQPIGATAFNDPRYIIAQWKSMIHTSDESTHMVIVIRESEKICCIAPFWKQRYVFPVEIGFKKVFSVNIHLLKCFDHSFIFRDMGEKNDAIFEHAFIILKQRFSPFDIMWLTHVRVNTPFGKYLNTHRFVAGIKVRKTFQTFIPTYRIHLGNSMEDLLATLNKKRRKNVRYNIKHYYEGQAENRFIKTTKPEQIESLLQAIQQIDDNAWQSTARGNTNVKTERNRLFYQELAHQGILRCYVLERNGTPIAYRLGVQSGYYFSGLGSKYDRANYEKLYPGIICLYHVLEELFQENTPEIVDLGAYDYGGFKAVWANDKVDASTLFLTGSYKGTAIIQTQAFLNRMVYFGKKILGRFGVKDWVLNFFKGKLRSTKPQSKTNENEADNNPDEK